MKTSDKNVLSNSFVKLKDDSWLERQRASGKITAGALLMLEELIKNKTELSLLEMDALVASYIADNKAIATFKNYKGFPGHVCISVNDALVHGIPNDYHLQDGDVITFDLGATFEGIITDSALTCIYGDPKKNEHVRLVDACEKSLYEGIKAIKIGARIGSIGYAINRCAKNMGFNVIDTYGGHGIAHGIDNLTDIPHAPPFVSNKSKQNEGIRIQPGLTIAIEPLLVSAISSTSTYTASDGWTVLMRHKDICAHYEHSVRMHDTFLEVLTYRGNETYLKSSIIKF
jgi:methionyl aminopeptidase